MTADEQRERRFHLVGVIARLRSGVPASVAERELGTIYRQLQLDHPDTTAEWTARVLPLRDLLLGDSTKALVVLGGAVLVLLTVAWINVAGLLLAWLPTRRHELVVRMALGATMAAVVRQLMAEALVWAGAGTAGGLVIATWFVHLFGAAGVSTSVPYDFEPRVDARVVVAVAALLLVSVLATALVPSVLAVRRSRDLVPKRTWGSHGLGRRVTVALQVALSIVLMSSAAGLLLRFQSLSALTTVSRTSNATVAVEVSLSEIRYARRGERARLLRSIVDGAHRTRRDSSRGRRQLRCRRRGRSATCASRSRVAPYRPTRRRRWRARSIRLRSRSSTSRWCVDASSIVETVRARRTSP